MNETVFVIHASFQPRKLSNAGYDVVYPEAPHVLPMKSTVDIEGQTVQVTNGGRENARAWFAYNRDDPCDTTESQSGRCIEYVGVEESVDVLAGVLRECSKGGNGDKEKDDDRGILALIGFSQGGTFAHILASLAALGSKKGLATDTNCEIICPRIFASIDAVICIGAFPAKHSPRENSTYHPRLDQSLETKSLHVIGKSDTSVCPELSGNLAALFDDADTYQHEKGHVVPTNSASCEAIIGFLGGLRTTTEQFAGR